MNDNLHTFMIRMCSCQLKVTHHCMGHRNWKFCCIDQFTHENVENKVLTWAGWIPLRSSLRGHIGKNNVMHHTDGAPLLIPACWWIAPFSPVPPCILLHSWKRSELIPEDQAVPSFSPAAWVAPLSQVAISSALLICRWRVGPSEREAAT